VTSAGAPEPLADALRALRRASADETRRRWVRGLPLDEELFDRWERARELGFGAETSVYQHAYVYWEVAVGDHTWIGPMTVLDGSGGLVIGSWCSISAGVQIYTHSTVRWAVSGGSAAHEYAQTTIGDRTFIGPASVVAKGVTIGDGCVVGAHAFVNRDLPRGSLAFGLPARVVGRVRVGADGAVDFEYADPAPAHLDPRDALA
jgi:acetyltransferase-like isoleucine patch superfamily enzyme